MTPPTDTGPPPCTDPTPEVCDGRDNDCDGVVDEGIGVQVFRDRDADGFGDSAAALLTCDPPPGWVAVRGDCDDSDPLASPAGLEVCDGRDNDCDGTVDQQPVDGVAGFVDRDGDGVGGAPLAHRVCALGPGRTSTPGDCDDDDPLVGLPAALDYADLDGDDHAGPHATVVCPADVVYAVSTDCDDTSASVHPGAPEQPVNGLDDDCDGQEACWSDGDLDGFGTTPVVLIDDLTCMLPGTSPVDDDCDDSRHRAYPGALELCANGHDDDCDPSTLDVPAPTGPLVYTDITTAAGLDEPGGVPATGCPTSDGGRPTVGDVDQDGDLDVFMPRGAAPDRLWLNDGTGRFTDARAAWGLPRGASSQRAALVDLDADGDLDLFVASSGPHPHALYRAEAGRFEDASVASGFDVPTGRCTDARSVSVLDVDGDLDLDLHVLGANPLLYRNDGAGAFTAELSLGNDAEDVQWADLDDDGLPDAVETSSSSVVFWHNDGDAGLSSWFSATTPSAGSAVVQRIAGGPTEVVVFGGTSRVYTPPLFTAAPLAWGLPNGAVSGAPFDADLDGSLELAIHGPDARLFDGDGTDRSCTTGSLAQSATLAQIAFDADGDRDLDLLQVTIDGSLRLLRNDALPTSSLRVRLRGPGLNVAGIGATVSTETPGGVVRQLLTIDQGQPAEVWLGIGGPVDVTVRWPDGASSVHPAVTGDVELERAP